MMGIIMAMIMQMNIVVANVPQMESSMVTVTEVVEQVQPKKVQNEKIHKGIECDAPTEKVAKEEEHKKNLCAYCGKDRGKNGSLCTHCLINNEFTELPKMNTDEEEQAFYDWHYFNEETKKWELM